MGENHSFGFPEGTKIKNKQENKIIKLVRNKLNDPKSLKMMSSLLVLFEIKEKGVSFLVINGG